MYNDSICTHQDCYDEVYSYRQRRSLLGANNIVDSFKDDLLYS
jgi:hypothetical protein